MNGDSQIVHHLPELFKEIQHDCYKAVGAGVVCYFTYRILRYAYIRNNVRKIREENKHNLEAQTAKVQLLVDNCGVDKEELNRIVDLSWNQLVAELNSGD